MTTHITILDRFENRRNGDTPLSEFNYWFYHVKENLFTVVSKDTGKSAICRNRSGNLEYPDKYDDAFDLDEMETRIRSDWEKYKQRPEYFVYSYPYTSLESDESNFNELLCGCAYLMEATSGVREHGRYQVPQTDILDKVEDRMKRCVKWLEDSEFYEGPASTRYHDAVPRGLLKHTLKVVKCMKDLMRCKSFTGVSTSAAILCALVHDWCKIGMYDTYTKNVKGEDGVWHQETAYTYKDSRKISLGHGVSSMYCASKFFNLSYEQCLAIRWHMGEYNVADNEMNELHQANCEYPIVQLLQFADRLSIADYVF